MAGGGQGAPGAQGGQFGGMPLGTGGQGTVPQRPPSYGGSPQLGGPGMYAGGSPGFREGPYGMPQGMQGNGPGGNGQMPGGMDPQRNPMMGGMKGPMGGMLPEDMLNMMRQRQQQGLLGGMKTGGPDPSQMPVPQGVGIGMSPPRLPPVQPGMQGGGEMAQIMSQYMPR